MHVCFLLGFLFHPDDGGVIFLLNIYSGSTIVIVFKIKVRVFSVYARPEDGHVNETCSAVKQILETYDINVA
jgi:hypothetical protein